MVDIATISTIVATVSVVVGVIFTMLEIRHLARTRRTELILKIYERFGSREVVDGVMTIGKFRDFDEYVKNYGLTGTVQVLEIFDEVGILLKQGLVDIGTVNDLFSPSVTDQWRSNILALVSGLRRTSGQPTFFRHVEYLFGRINVNG